jgi:hypothetical protein
MSAETFDEDDILEVRKMKIYEVNPKLLRNILLEYVEEKDLLF